MTLKSLLPGVIAGLTIGSIAYAVPRVTPPPTLPTRYEVQCLDIAAEGPGFGWEPFYGAVCQDLNSTHPIHQYVFWRRRR